MQTYESHDYILHALLILSFLAQLAPTLYALRICKMTGHVKYWSASWTLWVAVMLWIMVRRIVVASIFDATCETNHPWPWLFDQIVSPIVTSAGLTGIACLKFKFYKYWLEASVLRINGKKKTIANDRMAKEKGHIQAEQQAYENHEKDFRDRGPG